MDFEKLEFASRLLGGGHSFFGFKCNQKLCYNINGKVVPTTDTNKLLVVQLSQS